MKFFGGWGKEGAESWEFLCFLKFLYYELNTEL